MLQTFRQPSNWIVKTNHWVRSGSFAASFLMIASHLNTQPQSVWVWSLLAFHLLLYPHLLYLASIQSAQPMQIERHALLLEPGLMGAWGAWLGFPFWIVFPIWLGSLMSISIYLGPHGAIKAALTIATGVCVEILIFGFKFEPETGLLTSGLSMAALAIYLLMVAEGARRRGLQLRAARETLRQQEIALKQQLDANQTLQQQLRDQANRDPLTGLFNRRYLDATMAREFARCQRESQPLSLLVLDLDHFKQINDRYGHQAGDEVLRQVGELLVGRARQSDVVCRYGGEEYLVLLPNMTAHTAQARAEAYRTALQDMIIPFGNGHLRITLSIGLATFPQHAQTPQQLIQKADEALYQAKENGRNRVVIAKAQGG